MSAIGRNEPCPCGSGKKAKRSCGARRGPSDAELARAFLATRSNEAAVRLVRHGFDVIHVLYDEMLDLPGRHLTLQVSLPRLFPPALEALRTIVEHDGDASDAVVDAALRCIDSPQQRAALARTVIELAEAGSIERDLADTVTVDLDTVSSSFMRVSLLHAMSVLVGATRTPSGLLVVAR